MNEVLGDGGIGTAARRVGEAWWPILGLNLRSRFWWPGPRRFGAATEVAALLLLGKQRSPPAHSKVDLRSGSWVIAGVFILRGLPGFLVSGVLTNLLTPELNAWNSVFYSPLSLALGGASTFISLGSLGSGPVTHQFDKPSLVDERPSVSDAAAQDYENFSPVVRHSRLSR